MVKRDVQTAVCAPAASDAVPRGHRKTYRLCDDFRPNYLPTQMTGIGKASPGPRLATPEIGMPALNRSFALVRNRSEVYGCGCIWQCTRA
jgi:hypothetical protein